MIRKLCFILFLEVYFSKAHLQNNPVSSKSPENTGNTFLDCNAKIVPDKDNVPLNSGALVLEPREGDSPLHVQKNPVLEPVRTKRPYVYDHDAVDDPENKYFLEKPPRKLNVQSPESSVADEDTRRKENPELQNEYLLESNSSGPNLLAKLVEKCLTKRLLLAQRAGQINPEDLLNGRRSDSYDTIEDEDTSLEDPKSLTVDGQLVDPAEAEGLRRLNSLDKKVPLINHKRVCYACTSASSPNCWVPNRLTTVKYCMSGHDSCTTKTYQAGSQLVIVRDCGNTCSSAVGIDPVYKSCSICHSDFCNTNGAQSITSHGLILFLFVISLAKTIL